nr:VP5 [Letea virus]QIQ51198.1 VP5 [Letea virus]QIQ51208.1 VP5 [Letea virus]QIQ51228.1 VP5 [Letea virus]QIQ51248.1 VP5 [Letea virus]
MGKIWNSLKKAGKTVGSALTSKTAKNIYKTAGKAIKTAAESEIGSAAIQGALQGTMQTMLVGGNLGDNMKQAVLLNIMGTGEVVSDPLSPGETQLVNKLQNLEQREKDEEIYNKYHTEIEKILGEDVKKVRDFALQEYKIEDSKQQLEQDEIEILDKAVESYGKMWQYQEDHLANLSYALQKESAIRNANEATLVREFKSNFDSMKQAVEIERDALGEEAMEEILDLGTMVSEAIAEEVPVVGATVAAEMAGVKLADGAYKLTKVIQDLSGIDLSHMKVAPVQPALIRTMLDSDGGGRPTDQQLLRGVNQKLSTVREIISEQRHIQQAVLPDIKDVMKADARMRGLNEKQIHHITKAKMKVPKSRTPQIHIYTAPWDSDDIFFFHCISPYHRRDAFFLGFDLELEYVYFDDLKHQAHALSPGVYEVIGQSFETAYTDFFTLASNIAGVTTHHKKRLKRSATSHPIYLGSRHYNVSFDTLRSNALDLVHNEDIQMHVLRGPRHFQRRSILGALMYGLHIIEPRYFQIQQPFQAIA